MQSAFFILKIFKKFYEKLSTLSKIWNDANSRVQEVSCSLHHYDAMRTKRDLCFTPKHNGWRLIMASKELMWYVHVRPFFWNQFFKRNINHCYFNFLLLTSEPQNVLNFFLFFTNFSLVVLIKFVLIKKGIRIKRNLFKVV